MVAAIAVWFEMRSVSANNRADKTKVIWSSSCHMIALSGIGLVPISMKVLSKLTEEMPIRAVASFTLSTPALINVREPLRLVRVTFEIQSGNEGFVAPNDKRAALPPSRPPEKPAR